MKNFEEIIVTYHSDDIITYPEYKGKPYFSIQYEENGEHHVGYGTYNPQVLSNYIKDYFINVKEELENMKTEIDGKGLVDKLLEIDKDLIIGRDVYGNTTVCFKYGYIKEGDVLIGSYGRGKTFGEAVIDYCKQISGKILVFEYPKGRRETIKILI